MKITNLEELNQVVNDVVNRIVDVSTSRTMSSNYYASYEHVSDLISEEDFLTYFDLIGAELAGREEVLDLELTPEHEFNAIYGTAWCPGCADVHEEGFTVISVSQPLSMTRKAELLDNAIRNIQESLFRGGDKTLVEAAVLLGCTAEEMVKLGFPAMTDQEKNDLMTLKGEKPQDGHDPSRPIEFEVITENPSETRVFGTFEDALDFYNAVPAGANKKMTFIAYPGAQLQETEKDTLMMSTPEKPNWVNDSIYSLSDDVRLAHAKALFTKDPTDAKAWSWYNAYEERHGITPHRLGEDDIQIGNWRVHLIRPGAKYGRDDCLTNNSGKTIVEFYDLRYVDPVFSPRGQFTGASYYASTLLGQDEWGGGHYPNGLCLDAEIDVWRVTAKQMKEVLQFVREETTKKNRSSLDQMISSADKRAAEGRQQPSVGKSSRDGR